MSEGRRGLVYVALWIAESSWVYAAAGVPCLILGLGGAPLPWVAIAGLLATGMFATWVLGGVRGNPASLAIVQGVVGLVTVYAAMAVQRFDGIGGVDMLWVARAFVDEWHGDDFLRLSVALVLSIALWLRAGKLVSAPSLDERIQRTFRFGMAAVSAALITELATGTNIGARMMLLPFFGASLAGMAVNRLADPARAGRTRTWARVVGGSIGAILLLGLALGVLSGTYGAGALHLLSRGWNAFVEGLLWVLQYPLLAIFTVISAIGRWLIDLFGSGDREQELSDFGGGPPAWAEQAEEAVGGDWFEALMNVLQYPLAVILFVAVFLVLVLAYRRLKRRKAQQEASDRESIKGDADVGRDLVRLLGHLLPEWMRRRKGITAWRYPEGEPGVTEVFVLYFEYLAEAMRRGMPLHRRQTPSEREEALQQTLPDAPVGTLTRRFNAACYGREPSDPRTIARLTGGLERLRRASP